MPNKQEAMERMKRVMPKKMCWGLYHPLSEMEALGNRKKPQPRNHCGDTGMSQALQSGLGGDRGGHQGLPTPYLQQVEHEGGHPTPGVQAVHVRDALGPVGLEDSDDA